MASPPADDTDAKTVASPPPTASGPALPAAITGYEILERLGEGGMGAVYRARDVRLDREVALKLLPPHLVSDLEWRERFEREARVAALVQHPNVVACYALGEDGGRVYMALELVRGKDSDKLAKDAGGKLPERRALEIVRDGARGLVAIEKAGLVHRDIKPANVFVASTGEAKLGDLGLARGRKGDDRMTQTGAILGTPAFMAPEQANGEPDLDVRTDVYSLGATLFQLVTGRAPFVGPSPFATIAMLLRDPLRDPRELNPDLTEGTSRLIRKAMAKDKARRHQTAGGFLTALEGALKAPAPRPPAARERTVAMPGGKPSATVKKAPRVPEEKNEDHKAMIVVLGVFGALVVAVLLAFGFGPRARAPQLPAPPPAAPPVTLPPTAPPPTAPPPTAPPPTAPPPTAPPPTAPPPTAPPPTAPPVTPPPTPSPAKVDWTFSDLDVVRDQEAQLTRNGQARVVTGAKDWSRVSLMDATQRSIAGGLRVRWRVADVALTDHGVDRKIEAEHGFAGGGGSFFYELGIIDAAQTPKGASDLQSGLWLTLHLRKNGKHEALLRSIRPGQGGMHPSQGRVRHLDQRAFNLDASGVEILLAADEEGYRLSLPGEKEPIRGSWRGLEAVRDGLVKSARAWAHLGNWGGGGRGTGSVTVEVATGSGE